MELKEPTIEDLNKQLETTMFAAAYWFEQCERLEIKLKKSKELALEHDQEADSLRKIIKRLLNE